MSTKQAFDKLYRSVRYLERQGIGTPWRKSILDAVDILLLVALRDIADLDALATLLVCEAQYRRENEE